MLQRNIIGPSGLSFKVKVPKALVAGIEYQGVLPRFYALAGPMIVSAIRDTLGQDWLYRLNDEYRQWKLSDDSPMVHYPGKAIDQPLILTGDLYEGVEAVDEGDTLIVNVNPFHGVENGDDYAERLEDKAGYLERGFRRVERKLPALLARAIVESMPFLEAKSPQLDMGFGAANPGVLDPNSPDFDPFG